MSEAVVAEDLQLLGAALGADGDVEERGVDDELVEHHVGRCRRVGMGFPRLARCLRLLDEGNDGIAPLGVEGMKVGGKAEEVVRGGAAPHGGIEVAATVATADDDRPSDGLTQGVKETAAQPFKVVHSISRGSVIEAANVGGDTPRELEKGKVLGIHAMSIKDVSTTAISQCSFVRSACR